MKKEFYFSLFKLKNSSKLFLAIFLISLCTSSAFAQTKTVQGTITNESGEILPGANILEKDTSNGTVSDFDGNYSITVTGESTLVFSFVGYKAKEILVGNQTTINVSLETDNTLEEVVVIGYGTAKKSDLTGSISSISAKDFEKQPLSRVESALQGRAAGVVVTKNSGAAGADTKIRIRGSNSITGGNQPLIVIDGIIGGTIKSLNPNDIQSMEVLKDASATAIYGSRGANGVVLISTKKGRGKATIDVDYFTSFSQAPKLIDMLSPQEFADINGIAVEGGGTNYQKEYFKTGISQNLQVALSGGENKLNYYVSGGLVDEGGTTINSDYKRYSLRANLNSKFTEKLSVGLNLYNSIEEYHNLIAGGTQASTDARGGIINVLTWNPALSIRDANGNYNLQNSYGSGLVNPIAVRREADFNSTVNTTNANLNLSYKITDDLTFTILGGFIRNNTENENYSGIPAGSIIARPSASGSYGSVTSLQNSNILTWDKELGKSNLKITGIYETQKIIFKGLNASGGPMILPHNFYSIDLGEIPSVSANYSKSAIESWIGRAEYVYDNSLFITGTVRADESSKFRKGNRLGIFPSVSTAYKFDNLLPEDSFVQGLKLRAGYGETGSQAVNAYSTYNTLATGQNYPLNGLTESIGLALGNIGNPDLTWETTKQTNVGVDFNLLNGRLNVGVDAYWKNTTDLLLNAPIPNYEGGGTITRNVGEVSNKGFEFNVNGTIINNDKLNWSANFNISKNKNEVVSLNDGKDEILLTTINAVANKAGEISAIQVGQPLGQFYGATYLGTYKTGDTDGTPGHARYLKDTDGNDALGVIGNGTPTLTWGFNNTITYDDFDFNFVLRGSHGFDILNLTRAISSLPGGVVNNATIGEFRNRWTPDNQTDFAAAGTHYVNSTRFIENGSFVKLSNVALGYNIKSIKGFESLRLYASAQNLFTIANYTGYDPEASSTSVSNDQAASIDRGAYPTSRTVSLGLNLKF